MDEHKIDQPLVENGELFIWMQLLGLDRDAPDYGVKEWTQRMGYRPDGVCLFLPHPDIIHHHSGMDTEFTLHPDDCSYGAIPYNTVHARQPWTNYDLRGAVKKITEAGIAPYLSIQGASYNNNFHREWVTDHPEIYQYWRNGTHKCIMPLKRFADGTYYEDFFIEKLCQTLIDYDFAGFQMADNFCPSGIIHNSDFSVDLVDQFLTYTGIVPPAEIQASMNSDDDNSVRLRGDWIWTQQREQWILFHSWRWEGFVKKICDAVHGIGKKVIALAVYCTDPFETLYCNGIDIKRLMAAGVDYLMPNTLPSSVHMNGSSECFWRYMSTIPLNAAFLDDTRQLCMLGVKDSTEEWDVMQHTPNLFQRDMYTIVGQQLVKPDGCKRASDGIMICLGDSIEKDEWAYLHKNFAVAYTHDVESVLTPVALWSDAAMYRTVSAVIETGRWSAHKFIYEAANTGGICGATVRVEDIAANKGTLFVPNFDLLPENEQTAVVAYANGPIVCTVPAGYDLTPFGLQPDISFTDTDAKYPMTVFACGATLSDAVRARIAASLQLPDTAPEPEFSIDEVPTWTWQVPGTIPFNKHSTGFITALGQLLHHANDAKMPLLCDGPDYFEEFNSCECPNVIYKLRNGKYRVFLYNPERERYRRMRVSAKTAIADAQVVSFFPILPVKYVSDTTAASYEHNYDANSNDNTVYTKFITRILPNGVTVVDVMLVD